MKTAAAFINPNAGSLQGCTTPAKIKHKLTRLRLDPDITVGKTTKSMKEFAQTVKSTKPDIVIIAGGDGTISCIMKQLMGQDVVFGLIPSGSINNVARSIGLSGDFDEAIDVINRGNVGDLDVAKVGKTIVLESIGVGYLANIMHRIGEQDSSKDVLNVIRHTLAESLDPTNVKLKIIADGQEMDIETGWLTVTNLGRAAAVEVNPRSNSDDGHLGVTYFLPLSLTEVPQYMVQTLRGDHLTLPKVKTFSGKNIQLQLPPDTITHIDDKVFKRSRVDIQIEPSAYRVFEP